MPRPVGFNEDNFDEVDLVQARIVSRGPEEHDALGINSERTILSFRDSSRVSKLRVMREIATIFAPGNCQSFASTRRYNSSLEFPMVSPLFGRSALNSGVYLRNGRSIATLTRCAAW